MLFEGILMGSYQNQGPLILFTLPKNGAIFLPEKSYCCPAFIHKCKCFSDVHFRKLNKTEVP